MDSLFNKELCSERHERIEHELEKREEKIDSLEKCTIKLTQMIDKHEMMCEEHKNRIQKLEGRPIGVTLKILGYAVSAFLGAVATYLLNNQIF